MFPPRFHLLFDVPPMFNSAGEKNFTICHRAITGMMAPLVDPNRDGLKIALTFPLESDSKGPSLDHFRSTVPQKVPSLRRTTRHKR